MQLYLPPLAAHLIDSVTSTKAGANSVAWILKRVGGNGGKRYASFLRIGKSKNQQEVFVDLMKQYKDDSNMKFVALTMNMDNCGAGNSISGFEGQLEEILEVKRQFPDQLLIFLGVDPRWKRNGLELKQTVENYFNKKLVVHAKREVYPFVGIKIYPSMGFYPFDERLKETFDWAAEQGIPILSHCNYLGGIFNNDGEYVRANLMKFNPYTNMNYPPAAIAYKEQKSTIKWILGRQKADNNLNRCSYFMEPASFEDILDYYEKKGTPLKICLAHFGGGNQVMAAAPGAKASPENKAPYGLKNSNWFNQIKTLMTKYESLYTDISYALHDRSIHTTLLIESDDPSYGGRIMFGTDFFLTERESAEKDTYRLFKESAIAWKGNTQPTAWDRIAGSNIESFLKSRYYNGTVI